MLDEQGAQIFAMTDDIAERARKIGGTTLRSVGHIARLQRLLDNDADFVTPDDMLAELRDDNEQLVVILRQLHELTSSANDHATTSLIENWIDETERRHWVLFETTRRLTAAAELTTSTAKKSNHERSFHQDQRRRRHLL